MERRGLFALLDAAGRLVALALVIAVFYLVYRHPARGAAAVLVILGAPALAVAVYWFGRRALDHLPDAASAERVATRVHYPVMLLLGCAVVQAFATVPSYPGPLLPLPEGLGLVLLIPSAVLSAWSVLSLALQGWGAPMAVALSRRLAVSRLYAWTRNPMVLGALGMLAGAALWLRSVWFLVWTLLVAAPVLLAFVKVFEERELEIRFGASYRAYRDRTPFLWPRRPRS